LNAFAGLESYFSGGVLHIHYISIGASAAVFCAGTEEKIEREKYKKCVYPFHNFKTIFNL
jgi:hypothetical protein